MIGVIDVATNQIETLDEMVNTLRKVLQFVDADKLYPSTHCGMIPLSRHVGRDKLEALSMGSAILN
ncbi:hypothetical protein CL42_09800 [Acinetobacter sp. Ver3]|nr:hypothetical protein CL42_09800 [Acinetobacter sp. Ver3]